MLVISGGRKNSAYKQGVRKISEGGVETTGDGGA